MSDENSNWETPITSLVVIPAEESLSGTITSDGRIVTGSGTSLLADVNEGDWIYDSNQKEVRQVVAVSSRIEVLHLEKPFTLDIGGAIALEVVRDSEIEELSLLIDAGLADGTINNVPFPAGIPVTFKKEAPTRGRKGFIDPKVIDGTGTTVRVLTIK